TPTSCTLVLASSASKQRTETSTVSAHASVLQQNSKGYCLTATRQARCLATARYVESCLLGQLLRASCPSAGWSSEPSAHSWTSTVRKLWPKRFARPIREMRSIVSFTSASMQHIELS